MDAAAAAAAASPATAPGPHSGLLFYVSATVLAAYVLSRLLARRPGLVWGRARGLGAAMAHVQSVAHRGGRQTTTENSLAVR
jgi:hypothetical protein